MHFLKAFILSLLLLAMPTLPLYSNETKTPRIQEKPSLPIPDLSFCDDAMRLLEALGNGELDEKCSFADLVQLERLFITLVQQGVFSDAELRSLEEDTEDLFSSHWNGEVSVIPAVAYGQQNLFLRTGWISKKYKKIKRAIVKHPFKVLGGIGVAAVGGYVIYAIFTAAPAAGAVIGGIAAAFAEDEAPVKSTNEQKAAPKSIHEAIFRIKENHAEEIDLFEKSLAEKGLEGISPLSQNLIGTVKGFVSYLAHEALDDMLGQVIAVPNLGTFCEIKCTEEIVSLGHKAIDQACLTDRNSPFGTDLGSSLRNSVWVSDVSQLREKLSADSETGIIAAQFGFSPGEIAALRQMGTLEETVQANVQAFQTQETLSFWEKVKEAKSPTLEEFVPEPKKEFPVKTRAENSFSLPEFGAGFVKGLPKGVYDSGEGLALLASDLVQHPINTLSQVIQAFDLLSDLALSGQWVILSETLAPEIHQLVRDWHTLPSNRRGELVGYAFGKYGADILIPGAVAKVVSKGVKGAKELGVIYGRLQNAENTLLLEVAGGLQTGRNRVGSGPKSISISEEISSAKKVVTLEEAVAETPKQFKLSETDQLSCDLHKRAQEFLRPYKGKYLSEIEAKELLCQAGIETFNRPKGIPDHFLIKLSDKGSGIIYVDPTNKQIFIRVMPGKPHSSNICQKKPYVVHNVAQTAEGNALDKFGNRLPSIAPEAHIPIEEFVYRNK